MGTSVKAAVFFVITCSFLAVLVGLEAILLVENEPSLFQPTTVGLIAASGVFSVFLLTLNQLKIAGLEDKLEKMLKRQEELGLERSKKGGEEEEGE